MSQKEAGDGAQQSVANTDISPTQLTFLAGRDGLNPGVQVVGVDNAAGSRAVTRVAVQPPTDNDMQTTAPSQTGQTHPATTGAPLAPQTKVHDYAFDSAPTHLPSPSPPAQSSHAAPPQPPLSQQSTPFHLPNRHSTLPNSSTSPFAVPSTTNNITATPSVPEKKGSWFKRAAHKAWSGRHEESQRSKEIAEFYAQFGAGAHYTKDGRPSRMLDFSEPH